mgnify:CR=1 FL=1
MNPKATDKEAEAQFKEWDSNDDKKLSLAEFTVAIMEEKKKAKGKENEWLFIYFYF